MNLDNIRKQINLLDAGLRCIILHRMSLIPLVADYKLENGIQMYQPDREEEILETVTSFSKSAGINPELLLDIFKRIISESHRIEDNIIDGKTPFSATEYEKTNSHFEEYFIGFENALKELCTSMEKMLNEFRENGLTGEQAYRTFVSYYSSKHTSL